MNPKQKRLLKNLKEAQGHLTLLWPPLRWIRHNASKRAFAKYLENFYPVGLADALQEWIEELENENP